jgi:hypothetical protein
VGQGQQNQTSDRSWIGRHPVLFGSLVGFGVGFAGGYVTGRPEARGDPSSDYLTPEEGGFFFGGIGAGAGALIGLAVGRGRPSPSVQSAQSVAITIPSETDFPHFELFGGYSLLPAIQLDEFSPDSDPGHGFASSLDVNLGKPFGPRSQFGIGVDVDYQSWTDHGYDIGRFARGDERISVLYVSIGPRFVVVRTRRLAAFWSVSVDALSSHYSGHTWSNRTLGILNEMSPARSSGAWGPGMGGGVDVSVGERVAVRIAQVNYNLFNMGGERPGQRLRIKTGVVFTFN